MFTRVGVISGKIDNVDKYYAWAKLNEPLCHFIAQYDVPMNMETTIRYFEKGRGVVSPVLTVNFAQHMARLGDTDNEIILLGKMTGNIEEDEQVRRLRPHIYHGLAKGRWIKNPQIDSINSSTWLSGVRGRKTDVFKGQSVLLGDKGKGDRANLERVLDNHKDELEQCQIQRTKVLEGEYSALLKLPIALYYIPMLSALGAASQNFHMS